ncbi:MAG: hypothetical protein KKD02_09700 [Alphaproteobacteria bacterium]|jgi:ElaB/YqjD/DUF883 family membrane-anchored ribosome-binding protein|nr:hypothetical protein [Alphaproteobacteria bacterium]
MASTISKLRGMESDLEDQVAALTKELSALKKSVSRRGANAYQDTRDGASEVYGELWERFAESLPAMRKRARAAEKVARDNPATTAFLGLAVVGLAAALLLRR